MVLCNRNLVLPVLLCLFALSPASYAQHGENLFEFAYAGMADGGQGFVLSAHSLLKIFQDGTVIAAKGERVYALKLGAGAIARLKDRLAKEPLLRQSRYIEIEKGLMTGMHGGVSYIRYLSGDSEVLLATGVVPTGGKWRRLIRTVEGSLPPLTALFYPQEIQLWIQPNPRGCADTDKIKPDPWPHSDRLRLASAAHTVQTSDPLVIHYLFRQLYNEESSGLSWGACENGSHYTLMLGKVPGWYEDDEQAGAAFRAAEMQREYRKTR